VAMADEATMGASIRPRFHFRERQHGAYASPDALHKL
jgi:hypothetical protein